MNEQLPALVVVIPLLFSFLIYLMGFIERRMPYFLLLISSALTSLSSWKLLIRVIKEGPISYHIGGWEPPWGIEYRVDHLNGVLAFVVSLVAFLVILSFRERVEKEVEVSRWSQLYALFSLQLCGLLGITVTGDVFNLYVLLEIASFSAYAMVAIGKKGAEFSAFRYLIFGTIGACCYLLGVGHLYILTGSLNMVDIVNLLKNLPDSSALKVGLCLLVIGIGVKMALFPLHTWLPDAYSQAPSTVSAFLAPLATKVAGYVLLRILFWMFKPTFPSEKVLLEILGWLALIGAFFFSFMAIVQKELRRAFCYLLLSEISFLGMGVSSGNLDGLRGAILHLINDVFMMGCLFTSICAFIHLFENEGLKDLEGLGLKNPWVSLGFLIGGLSVIGIPPLGGFFSKWYLILGTIEGKKWHLSVGLLVSSLINAVLIFKILERIYLKGTHLELSKRLPFGFLVSLLSFSISLLLLGGLASTIVKKVIDPWIFSLGGF